MNTQPLRRRLRVGVLTLTVVAAFPPVLRAGDILLPDFMLWDPMPGSVLEIDGALIPVIGEPLNIFEFDTLSDDLECGTSPAIPGGPQPTGTADTIVRRSECIHPPSDDSPPDPENMVSPITIEAMQMGTVGVVNLGAGLARYFFTAGASTGTITYKDPNNNHGPGVHGTFQIDTLSVILDIWKDRLPQPGDVKVRSVAKTLVSTLVPWSHVVPQAANPSGTSEGSFATIPFELTSSDGTKLLMQTATVPEPSTMILLGTGIAGVAARVRRRRRQHQA